MDDLKHTFKSLFDTIRNEQPAGFEHIQSVCAGIAGLENFHSRDELHTYLKDAFKPNTRVELCPDALTALYSGTNGEPGIVNIAGTGSIAFGVTTDGGFVRTGGWGYLLDQSGSGYGIGRDALQTVFRAYDGIIPPTPLTDYVLKRFNVATPPELIPHLYSHVNSRMKIASVCEDVFHLMRTGDQTARNIIEKAASDMAEGILNLIKHHFNREQGINVVLTGSVFKSKDLIVPLLKNKLPTEIQLIQPSTPPVAGPSSKAIKS